MCLQEGWIPASAGMTDEEGMGVGGEEGSDGRCAFRRDGFTPWRICDLPPQE